MAMQQQKLPPLSMSPKGHSLADRIDEDNPFESTWSILKALKTEVRELQATVRAEQHMRESEVSELRRELKELREELAKEKAERKSETKNVVDPVSNLCSTVQLELRKVKAVREAQITELKEALEDEKKSRESGLGGLTQQLHEEEANRMKSLNNLTESLNETRRLLDATGNDCRHNIHNLVQDMKTLSDHLLRVTNTWQGLKTDNLLSYAHHTNSQRSPGTAYGAPMTHPSSG